MGFKLSQVAEAPVEFPDIGFVAPQKKTAAVPAVPIKPLRASPGVSPVEGLPAPKDDYEAGELNGVLDVARGLPILKNLQENKKGFSFKDVKAEPTASPDLPDPVNQVADKVLEARQYRQKLKESGGDPTKPIPDAETFFGRVAAPGINRRQYQHTGPMLDPKILTSITDELPFGADAAGAIRGAQAYEAYSRIAEGKPSPDDVDFLSDYIADEEAVSETFNEKSTFWKGMSIASDIPRYGAEMYLTGGSKPVKGLLTGLGKEGFKQFLKKVTTQVGASQARKTILAAGGKFAGRNIAVSAAATAVNPAGVASDALKAALPSVENGKLTPGDSLAQAIPSAFAGRTVDTLTERMGGMAVKPLGNVARAAIPTVVDDFLVKMGGRAAGATSGAARAIGDKLSKVPGAEAAKRTAFNVGGKLMKPVEMIDGLHQYAKKYAVERYRGMAPKAVKEAMKGASWHGLVGESLEERYGEAMRAALDTLGFETGDESQYVNNQLYTGAKEFFSGNPGEAWNQVKQALETLAAEGIGFAPFSALGMGANIYGSRKGLNAKLDAKNAEHQERMFNRDMRHDVERVRKEMEKRKAETGNASGIPTGTAFVGPDRDMFVAEGAALVHYDAEGNKTGEVHDLDSAPSQDLLEKLSTYEMHEPKKKEAAPVQPSAETQTQTSPEAKPAESKKAPKAPENPDLVYGRLQIKKLRNKETGAELFRVNDPGAGFSKTFATKDEAQEFVDQYKPKETEESPKAKAAQAPEGQPEPGTKVKVKSYSGKDMGDNEVAGYEEVDGKTKVIFKAPLPNGADRSFIEGVSMSPVGAESAKETPAAEPASAAQPKAEVPSSEQTKPSTEKEAEPKAEVEEEITGTTAEKIEKISAKIVEEQKSRLKAQDEGKPEVAREILKKINKLSAERDRLRALPKEEPKAEEQKPAEQPEKKLGGKKQSVSADDLLADIEAQFGEKKEEQKPEKKLGEKKPPQAPTQGPKPPKAPQPPKVPEKKPSPPKSTGESEIDDILSGLSEDFKDFRTSQQNVKDPGTEYLEGLPPRYREYLESLDEDRFAQLQYAPTGMIARKSGWFEYLDSFVLNHAQAKGSSLRLSADGKTWTLKGAKGDVSLNIGEWTTLGELASQLDKAGFLAPHEKMVLGILDQSDKVGLTRRGSATLNPMESMFAALWSATEGGAHKGEIRLSTMSMMTPSYLVSNLIHEATHAHTSHALAFALDDRRMLGGRGMAFVGWQNLSDKEMMKRWKELSEPAKRIRDLYDVAKERSKAARASGIPYPAGGYWMTDIYEFVAEAMSNRDFQRWLSGQAGESKSLKLSSLWKDFVRALADLLGLNPSQRDMLGETLENIAAVITAEKKWTRGDFSEYPSLSLANRDPRKLGHKDVTKRVPELTEGAKKLKDKELTREQYEELVEEFKPVYPFASIPEPSSTEAMQEALSDPKKPKLGKLWDVFKEGDPVRLRLDIPGYTDHGVWIVSVHPGVKSGEGGTVSGSGAYEKFAVVRSPHFGIAEERSLDIATGESRKNPIATVGGFLINQSWESAKAEAEQALKEANEDVGKEKPRWAQVGMDPERHSYFYDRNTMQPVERGEKAIQVGPLVLVKNPQYAPKTNYLYNIRTSLANVNSVSNFEKKHLAAVAKLTALAVNSEKLKVRSLDQLVKLIKNSLGEPLTLHLAPVIEFAWDRVAGTMEGDFQGVGDKVADVLAAQRKTEGEDNASEDSAGKKDEGVPDGPGKPDADAPPVSDEDAEGRDSTREPKPEGSDVPGDPGAPAQGDAGGGVSDDRGDSQVGTPPGDQPVLAGGESAEQGREEAPSDVSEVVKNHVIEDSDIIVPGGQKARFNANLAAIKLLKALEEQNRLPTAEEKKVLAKFTGWGGLTPYFDIYKDSIASRKWKEGLDWKAEYGEGFTELRKLLTPEEWQKAEESTANAHYTEREIAKKLWDIAKHVGFKGGRYLEPGAGIGNFAGLMPEDLRPGSKGVMVEMDAMSARLLRKLYPENAILEGDLAELKIAPHTMDLVIGNVPFHEVGPGESSARYGIDLNLHNYFIARSIDAVKPGGLVIVISSNSTLDNNPAQAKFLAGKADLIGAIRLPYTAFKENASTEVTTDILIFRKPVGTENMGDSVWFTPGMIKGPGSTLAEVEGKVSSYFIDHPEMAMGRHTFRGTMRRPNSYRLEPNDKKPLLEQLEETIKKLPENILEEKLAEGEVIEKGDTAPPEGTIEVRGDKLFVVHKRESVEIVPKKMPRKADAIEGYPTKLFREGVQNVAKNYVEVRSALRELVKVMLNGESSDEQVKEAQLELNRQYDNFTGIHGPINLHKDINALESDPDFYKVLSIENVKAVWNADKKGIEYSTSKGDIFSKRVLGPKAPPLSVPNVRDGVTVSLGYRGRIDTKYIANLAGISEEEVTDTLKKENIAFRDPVTGEYVSNAIYLSGNVREKLLRAIVAEGDAPGEYKRNVDALKEVQPKRVSIKDIRVRLGQQFVPPEVFAAFARSILRPLRPIISFKPETEKWEVRLNDADKRKDSNANDIEYSVTKSNGSVVPGHKILEYALNFNVKPALSYTVMTPDGTRNVPDPGASAEAAAVIERMDREFQNFLRIPGSEHGALVEEIWNNTTNHTVETKNDGSHMNLPGSSEEIKMRPYQRDAIARLLREGSGMLAHAVGAGKAQPLDARILTPTGWKLMGEIKIGDSVIAADGTATEVTGVYPQGKKEIFSVKFSDGSVTECCDEHLWLTQTYKERTAACAERKLGKSWPSASPKVRSLKEIRETLIDYRINTPNHSIPMVGAVDFQASPVPVDPYTLGVILGDGCTSGRSVAVSGVDAEIFSGMLCQDNVEVRAVASATKCPTVAFRMKKLLGRAPNPMVAAIESLGLMNCLAKDKFIPEQYIVNSVECRLNLLRGLMDTDGSVSKAGSSIFYSVSSRLVDGVRSIVQSLGGTVSVSVKKPKYTHKGECRTGLDCYVVHICLPAEFNPFRLKRKASRVIPKTKYAPSRRITEVESVGEKEAQCISVAHESKLYVTDDYIVTHNTYTLIGTAMEMRRLGMAKRPVIVVQNATLGQFSTSFMKMYPGANVLVATTEDLGAGRHQFLARMQTGDWDAVVMAQSTFDMLEVHPETESAHIRNRLSELEEAHMAAAREGHPGNSPKVRDLVKAKKNLRKRLDKIAAKKADDEAKAAASGKRKRERLIWEDLGVDALFVDEAHAYKKPPFATKLGEIVGLQKQISSVGEDIFMKVRQVQARNKGRGVIFATGTPVTNTLGEAWHMMNLVAPNKNREFGVNTFDEFVSKFALNTTILESNAAGEPVMKEALSKFVNGYEFISWLRSTFDVLTPDELRGFLVEKNEDGTDKKSLVPEMRGGDIIKIVVPANSYIEEFKDYILEAYDYYKSLSGREKIANRWVGGQLYAAGKYIAIDTRMLYPKAKEQPNGKIAALVSEAIREYKDSSDRNGAQLIFSDIFNTRNIGRLDSFYKNENLPEGYETLDEEEDEETSEKKAWLFSEIRSKLIAGGVPAREIAIVAEHKKEDREALFDRVKSGEIRFIMGSTESLGTGVNVQDRVTAIHHVDIPWLPSALEQRNGRGLRYGNIYHDKGVGIYMYATESTLDGTLLKKIVRKSKGIHQVMGGRLEGREFDDPAAEVALSMEEMAAIAEGNENFFKKIELEKVKRDLEMARESILSSQTRAREYVKNAAEEIAARERSIANGEETLTILEKVKSENPPDMIIAGKSYDLKDKEQEEAAVEALGALMTSLRVNVEAQTKMGSLAHFTPERFNLGYAPEGNKSPKFLVGGLEAQYVYGMSGYKRGDEIILTGHGRFRISTPGDSKTNLYRGEATTPNGLLAGVEAISNVIKRTQEEYKAEIENKRSEIDSSREILEKKWDRQEQLDKVSKDLQEVEVELVKEAERKAEAREARRQARRSGGSGGSGGSLASRRLGGRDGGSLKAARLVQQMPTVNAAPYEGDPDIDKSEAGLLARWSDIFGVTLLEGYFSEKAQGIYKWWLQQNKGPGVVRMKPAHFNVYVGSHEIAHHVDITTATVASLISDAKSGIGYDAHGKPTTNKLAMKYTAKDVLDDLYKMSYVKSASKKLMATEGWAEFIRHYMTENDAHTIAPKLYDWYLNTWTTDHRKLAEKLKDARTQAQEYTNQGVFQRARSIFQPINHNQPWSEWFEQQKLTWQTEFMTKQVDRFWMAKKIDERLKEAGFNPKDKQTASLWDFLIGYDMTARARASASLEVGVFSVRLGEQHKLGQAGSYWDGIKRNVNSDREYEEAISYAHARHTIYMNDVKKVDFFTGKNIDEARKIVDQVKSDPSKAARYEDLAKHISRYANDQLSMLVDAGALSAKDRDMMVAFYGDYYFPLHRQIRPVRSMFGSKTSKPGAGASNKYVNLGKPVKPRSKEGSAAPLYDPSVAIMERAVRFYDRAAKTRVIHALVGRLDPKIGGMSHMGDLIDRVPPRRRLTKARIRELLKQLVDNGIVPKDRAKLSMIAWKILRKRHVSAAEFAFFAKRTGLTASATSKDLYDAAKKLPNIEAELSIWRDNLTPNAKKATVIIHDLKGRPVMYQVDKNLYEMLTGMDESAVGMWTKLFGVAGQLFRAGAVNLNPAFGLFNPSADMPNYMVTGKDSPWYNRVVAPICAVLGISTAKMRKVPALGKLVELIANILTVVVNKGRAIAGMPGIEGTNLQMVRNPNDVVIRYYELLGGGLFSPVGGSYASHQKTVRRKLFQIRHKKPGLLAKAGDTLDTAWYHSSNMLEAVQSAISVTDMYPRLAQFEATMNAHGYFSKGDHWVDETGAVAIPPEHVQISAIVAAGNSTTNFKVAGTTGRKINTFLPLYNPGVQGLYRWLKLMHNLQNIGSPDDDKKLLAQKTMAMMLATSVCSMLYWLFRHNDSDYQNQTPDVKEKWLTLGYGGKTVMKVAKVPLDHNGLVWNATAAGLDAIFHSDKGNRIDDVIWHFATDSVPTGGGLGRAALETFVADYDFWRKTDLIPSYLKNRPKQLQFTEYTMETSKLISAMLGHTISPIKVDHFMNGLTGGMYRRVLDTAETIGSGQVPSYNQLPLLRGVFPDRHASQPINDIYDKSGQLDKLVQLPSATKEDRAEKQRLDQYIELMHDIRALEYEKNPGRRSFEYQKYLVGLANEALGYTAQEDNPAPYGSSVPADIKKVVFDFSMRKAKLAMMLSDYPHKAEKGETMSKTVADYESRQSSAESWLNDHKKHEQVWAAVQQIRKSQSFKDLLDGKRKPTDYAERQIWNLKRSKAKAWER